MFPFHETATLTINTTKIEEGTIEIKNILGATAQPPKDPPGAKIISIKTVERPDSLLISVPEPPPSALPAVDPALLTGK